MGLALLVTVAKAGHPSSPGAVTDGLRSATGIPVSGIALTALAASRPRGPH
ncbi:hypothetical protein SAMN05421874_13836 [Nonomuraea maritima]|uniref:Uncharacterized protein n=1 Tax=Nonomuraea maritima TaxID=683260 RepID=A0A1G9QD50_9ACTN|nr:hypothetical protein SAMN05421874_13836 [Nonomuraea maritima]